VILIEQKDPAAAIFETAGRAKIANKLNTSLMFVGLPVSGWSHSTYRASGVYRAAQKD
jgi:hypothetical protein